VHIRVIFASLVVWAGSVAFGAEGTLTILHTNGLNGRFEQMIKAAALKKQIQQEVGQVVLVDAGNVLSPREVDFVHAGNKPSATVDMMNQAGYDAWVLGKNALSLPQRTLTDFLRSARFPVLGANIHQPQSGRMLFQVQPFTMGRSGGLRVGILGLTQGGSGVVAGDPVRAAQYFVPMLRREVDVVVLLTHQAYDIDSTLAAEVPGIDAIVGTHTQGASVGRRVVNGVPIRQAGPYGEFVGRIDLEVSQAGVELKNAQLLPLDVSVGQTGDLQAALGEWMLPVGGESLSVSAVLGTSAGGFGASVGQAGALGYLLADLMRTTANVDVALVSALSVDSELPEGPIRVMDLYRIYSPTHKIKIVSLKGEDLRSLMESGLDDLSAFFYPSGLSVVYDLARIKGKRLVSLATADKRPLNLQKTFRVAVESDLTRFEKGTPTGLVIRNLLANHIRKAGVIRGKLDDRLREP